MPVRARDYAVESGVEVCPQHGAYDRNPLVGFIRKEALRSPGVDVARARALLQESEEKRRWCPKCDGPAPSVRQWATDVRDDSPACGVCGGEMTTGAVAGGFRTHPGCGPDEP